MVNQYPHYLFALIGGESIQDENGNWTESESTSIFISTCREETDGRGTQIQVAGGTFHVFSSLIQLPKDAQRVEVGTTVFVSDESDGSTQRIKGTVLKYDNGQLHSRLWV